MANTTNLNLSKLAGTEKLKTFPSPYNDNMDTIDSAFGAGFGLNGKPSVNTSINNLADGLAIVANGNTHAAITSGQYVYVRNHGSLSEGLYTATSNISANGTLSGSNLTADSFGGLNAVYSGLNSSKVNKSDIVNNLTTNDSTKVLSAAQGYALNSQINQSTTLTDGDDLNNCTTAGTYFYASPTNISNVPSSAGQFAVVFVFGYAGSGAFNIIQLCSTSGNHLYYRRHVGANADPWSTWREITMTAVN